MKVGSIILEEEGYHVNSLYVCKHPGIIAEITRLPAGSKDYPPLAITGVTFDICKEGARVVAETRVKRLEQELTAAQKHLIQVLSLKESDVK